jgi:hypothetical protein
MFGSVYKTTSIRSVSQVEPSNHEDSPLSVILRESQEFAGGYLQKRPAITLEQRRMGFSPKKESWWV